MSLETSDDRVAMLAALGETFLWQGVEFPAVFETPYELTLGMDGAHPVLTTDPDLADGIAVGDTVTRVDETTDYTVRSIEPDGFGMTRMSLERV